MIITEIKYYNINIKNQINFDDTLEINPNRCKSYKLIYQICQYEKLKNQDTKYINRLRKSGVKVITKKKKINGEMFLEYYKVYTLVNKDFKYRKKLVDIILNKQIFEKEFESNIITEIYGTGKDEKKIKVSHTSQTYDTKDFLQLQNRKNVVKTTQDELSDEYLITLDIISSYLMCDNKLANCVQNDYITVKEDDSKKQIKKAIRRHKRKYTPTKKQTFEEYKKWKEKNKLQVKRWRKSKTYKLNNLYSYTYGKNTIAWDWLKKEWVEHKSPFNINIKRLIDPLKPRVTEWRSVDINNNFEFNKKKFNIDEKVKSYEVKNKANCINDELNKFTNEAKMDKILCFYIPHKDKYYFFDENIDKISNKYITNTN